MDSARDFRLDDWRRLQLELAGCRWHRAADPVAGACAIMCAVGLCCMNMKSSCRQWPDPTHRRQK